MVRFSLEKEKAVNSLPVDQKHEERQQKILLGGTADTLHFISRGKKVIKVQVISWQNGEIHHLYGIIPVIW